MVTQNDWLLQMIDNFFKNLIDKSFYELLSNIFLNIIKILVMIRDLKDLMKTRMNKKIIRYKLVNRKNI
jgi:hypothetical protein